ncbi:MAG: ABC transporter substrate-binding protein [Alphaproteobacteria bacterium]|nr:ABC transporter substrate-binding protein [Alphaproteobacteria bacterium]
MKSAKGEFMRVRLSSLLAAAVAIALMFFALPMRAENVPVGNTLAKDAGAARQLVDKLHTELLAVMKEAKTLGFQGRVQKLTPALETSYAFSDMARIAVGSHWKNFSDDQKQKVIAAFGRMSVATYASRLTDFDGERFEVTGVEALPPPDTGIVVRSRVVDRDGTDEKLVYRLRKTGNEWRIVDVFYRGAISELATQRAQFLDVLKTGGYDALIKRMEERTRDMAEGKEG